MNQFRKLNPTKNKPKFPRWLTQLEELIAHLHKTIGVLIVTVKNTYSKHQKSLLEKFRKKIRNMALPNLQSKLYLETRIEGKKLKIEIS